MGNIQEQNSLDWLRDQLSGFERPAEAKVLPIDTVELPVAQPAPEAIRAECVVPASERVVYREPRFVAKIKNQPTLPLFEYFEGGEVDPGMYVRDYDVMKHPALRKLVGIEEGESVPQPMLIPQSPTVSTANAVAEVMPDVTEVAKTPLKRDKRVKTAQTEKLSFSGYIRRVKVVGALSIAAVSLVGGYKAGGGPSLYSDGDLLSVPKNLAANVQQVFIKPFPTISAQLTRIHK